MSNPGNYRYHDRIELHVAYIAYRDVCIPLYSIAIRITYICTRIANKFFWNTTRFVFGALSQWLCFTVIGLNGYQYLLSR